MPTRAFRKDDINHIARIITYVDIKKGKKPKLISFLTNDFDMTLGTIVAIYRRRWQIESLFKQIKQNFPLRYFYGEGYCFFECAFAQTHSKKQYHQYPRHLNLHYKAESAFRISGKHLLIGV